MLPTLSLPAAAALSRRSNGFVRAAFPPGAGQGPYTVAAYPNGIGFVILDGLHNELIGVRWYDATHTQLYYRSSYIPPSGLFSAVYCTAPDQTVSPAAGYTVTSTGSISMPGAILVSPYGKSVIEATSPANAIANNNHGVLGHYSPTLKVSMPALYREKQMARQKGDGGGVMGCTAASLSLGATTAAVGLTGIAGAASAGLNVFADAGFWASFGAWGAAYAFWDDECF